MKQVINLILEPTPQQNAVLYETLTKCNEIANWLSEQAIQTNRFNQAPLYHMFYKEIRNKFSQFPSQLAIKTINKVSEAYRGGAAKKITQSFPPLFPQAFDDRMMNINRDGTVSILTIRERLCAECSRERSGRIFVPFTTDIDWENYVREGDADLLFRNDQWIISYIGKRKKEED